MPNYCECHLRISDDNCELNIAPILEAISSDKRPIDFKKIIPYPAEWEKADTEMREWEERVNQLPPEDRRAVDWSKRPKDGYNQGGYEWCIQNWGTKWNAGDTDIITIGEYEAIFKFDTAWSPPIPVISKLSEMFPAYGFQLEYYEMGMQFCGSINWRDGKIEQQAQAAYHGWRGG